MRDVGYRTFEDVEQVPKRSELRYICLGLQGAISVNDVLRYRKLSSMHHVTQGANRFGEELEFLQFDCDAVSHKIVKMGIMCYISASGLFGNITIPSWYIKAKFHFPVEKMTYIACWNLPDTHFSIQTEYE